MIRGRLHSLAAGLLLLTLLPSAASAETRHEPTPPVPSTTLIGLSPASLPAKGTITITGTVTNPSDSPWRGLSANVVASTNPLTTPIAVAHASSSPDDVSLTASSAHATPLPDVDVGATTPFTLTVSRDQLPMKTASGVYILGVTLTGHDDAGRPVSTLSRTFLPSVGSSTRAAKTTPPTVTPLSLVIPMRAPLTVDTNGAIADGFSPSIGADGRLSRLVNFAGQAGTHQVTWLVDPAVLDTADRLASGNPGFLVDAADQHAATLQSPSGPASTFLTAALATLRGGNVLALPYADADAVALARANTHLLTAAQSLSAASLNDRHISSSPAIAPPEHSATDAALGAVIDGTTVLVGDTAMSGAAPVRSASGHRVIAETTATAEGGPGGSLDALSVRQRILADAVLRASGGNANPFVVALPDDWDPGTGADAAGFFSGLDQPWLQLNPLPGPTSSPVNLSYPDTARKAEVPPANVTAAGQLLEATTALTSVLTLDAPVSGQLRDQLGLATFGAVSYGARATGATAARGTTTAITSHLRDLLSSVAIEGTNFVTLSGSSGVATVSVVNGLNRSITVGVREQAGGPEVTIDPIAPLVLEAGQRSTVRLQVNTRGVGVRDVKLTPVTSAGTFFGTPLTFTLRTSQVGTYVWGILGLAVLLGAVATWRRLQRKRRARQPR